MNILLVHHPLSWLDSWAAKRLQKTLNAKNYLVFTGHEHQGSIISTNMPGYGESTVIEAPRFVSDDSGEQGFSVAYCDTVASVRQVFQVLWKDDSYKVFQAGQVLESHQALLPLSPISGSGSSSDRWTPSSKFREFLDGTDLLFSGGGRESAKLANLFVAPNLRELTRESDYQKSRSISGSILFKELQERSIIFILGPDQSGKTALAKSITEHFLKSSKVPLMALGQDLPSNVESYRAFLSHLSEQQFGRENTNAYSNLPLQRRVVLVDNYQDSPKNAKKEHRVLKMLNSHCSQLIIFCEETDLTPLDMAEFAIETEMLVSIMTIQPLTLPLQRQLIEKWYHFDSDLKGNSQKFVELITQAMKLVGGVVGRGVVPSFPPYVLAILQSLEAGQPVDVTASTHGHLYEAFINAALSRRKSVTNHNILTSFTSYLAFNLFTDDLTEFSPDYASEIHFDWKKRTDLSRNRESLLDDLLQLGLLKLNGGVYRFSEKFIFYYFVAFWMKDRTSSEPVQLAIQQCVEKVV